MSIRLRYDLFRRTPVLHHVFNCPVINFADLSS